MAEKTERITFNTKELQQFLQGYRASTGAVDPHSIADPVQKQQAALKQAEAFLKFMESKNTEGGSNVPASQSTYQAVQQQPVQQQQPGAKHDYSSKPQNFNQRVDLEQESPDVTPGCNPFSGGGQSHKHGHGHGHSHGGHSHSHGGQTPDSGGAHSHGHSHGGGHSHGDRHGHGGHHKHKHGWMHKIFQYGLGLKFFTSFMPFNAWLITFAWIAPSIQDPFDKVFCRVWITFTASLVFISYYYACTVNSYLPPKNVPVFEPSSNQKTCKVCNNQWKPERSHHCSTCGKCVIKMDHHCPWIVGCVGHRNHKSFLLFCIYMTTGASYFLFRSVLFAFQIFGTDEYLDYSLFFYLYWIVTFAVILPFTVMGATLAFFHSMLALNNSTTLESMGGRSFQFPCLPRNPKKSVNPYSKGFIPDLCDFLHNRVLLWWFPTVPEDIDEGTRFSKNPTITMAEYEMMHKSMNIMVIGDQSIDTGSKDKERKIDFAEMLKQAEEMTVNKHLQYGNKMFEFGKRKDQFFKPIEASSNS